MYDGNISEYRPLSESSSAPGEVAQPVSLLRFLLQFQGLKNKVMQHLLFFFTNLTHRHSDQTHVWQRNRFTWNLDGSSVSPL